MTLHRDLSRSAYEALPGVNWSTLKHMVVPARYRWIVDNPQERKQTDAMRLGVAAHTMLLEPERFEVVYTVEPAEYKGKPYEGDGMRARWRRTAEATGLEILTADEHERVRGMAKALADKRERRTAAHRCMRGPGENEVTMTWEDQFTGRACKGRVDRITQTASGGALVVDVKTTKDASRWSFERDLFKREYFAQLAFYFDGFERATGHKPEAAAILAIESEPPYASAFYPLSQRVIETGRRHYGTLLNMLDRCEASTAWPGYESDELDVPKYYMEFRPPTWATGGKVE